MNKNPTVMLTHISEQRMSSSLSSSSHYLPWYGPEWLNLNLFQAKELESFTTTRCPIFYSSVWIRTLVFSHFISLYTTTGYYIIAPMRRELYILFVGIGMVFDLLLNWGLTIVLKEPGPYWTNDMGCGANVYNTPDPYVEQYVFVFVSVIGYYAMHDISLSFHERAAMTITLALLSMAQVRLGYSSPRQIAMASVVGTAEGVLFQLIGFYIFARYAARLSELWLVKVFGYRDTMFIAD